jgi:hypothetical protein
MAGFRVSWLSRIALALRLACALIVTVAVAGVGV